MSVSKVRVCYHLCLRHAIESMFAISFLFTSCDRELNSVEKTKPVFAIICVYVMR